MGRPEIKQLTIGWINAAEPGFLDRVLDRIASVPDGLTRAELWDLFPRGQRQATLEALRLLLERKQVVEVTRTHPTREAFMDHLRLFTLKGEGRVR